MAMTHVEINTAKLEESIKFYQEVVGLGIRTDMRGTTPFNIVFMANSQEEVAVELIESEKPFNGSGIMMGFPTADVKAKHDELEAAGWKPGDIVPSGRFFVVNDPNGVGVQFMISK